MVLRTFLCKAKDVRRFARFSVGRSFVAPGGALTASAKSARYSSPGGAPGSELPSMVKGAACTKGALDGG